MTSRATWVCGLFGDFHNQLLVCIMVPTRTAMLFGALLIATPAHGQDFPYRGQWEVRHPDTNYVAVVLIDGERRATWDSPKDADKSAEYFGYVAEASGSKMTIILTNRTGVTKTYCDVRSSDLLHCYVIRASGNRSDNFLLVRVGAGPVKLTRASQ